MENEVAELKTMIASMAQQIATMQASRPVERLLSYYPGETADYILNDGDTAWMMTSIALVLFMTIPGLMLYYSGMVRDKNVLSTAMTVFSITCLITVLWLAFGYSLSFAPALANPYGKASPVWGNASRFWLRGMHLNSYHQLAPTIPEAVYCAFQLTFAIITPALIVGSFADRMKYWPMLLFIALWHLLVYCPIAHSIWHPEGFLFKAGALDFAGGNVVHISSGISGLVSSIILGKRKGFGKEVFEPHNILLTATGASMLWVGWFGFNAGSACTAGTRAGYALLITHIATATAALTWMITETFVRGAPSVMGMVSGAVAGLVAVTPASGYVDPTGAFIIGLLAGPVCYGGAQMKRYFGYDDALDAFGVHAVGGILGGILTGFFTTDQVVAGYNGVFYAGTKVGGTQLGNQLYAIVTTAGWSAFASFFILMAIDLTIGLRVSAEDEEAGLDVAIYQESISGSQHSTKSKENLAGMVPAAKVQIQPATTTNAAEYEMVNRNDGPLEV